MRASIARWGAPVYTYAMPRQPPARAPRDRRSLSTVAAPGRIGADGEPGLARQLAEALGAARDRDVAESLTHPVHTYPARMHPGTARLLVDLVAGRARPGSLLVDPFCGSGTTLVEARAASIRAIGCDLSPLATMIARAKTWTVAPSRRRVLKERGHRIAGETMAAGKEARRSGWSAPDERRPEGFDPNARNRRVGPWFAPHVRRELEDLAERIEAVREDDAEVGDVLLVCLSAILYKVSYRSSDTDPTKVKRNIGRGMAARLFAQRVELLCAGLDDLGRVRGPQPEVLNMDARKLGEVVPDGGAVGVVTSPPYAGTYDYAETQRLRFDFFGIRHRDFDEGEIGARRGWDDGTVTGQKATARWKTDLQTVLGNIATVLAPRGLAALVIGDSMAAGRGRHADEDVRAALDDRLAMVAWAWQERPMLGAAERHAFAARGKREHVLLLERR
jgi:SAM-dependent methyltransferase